LIRFAVEWVLEVGDASIRSVGNERTRKCCRMKDGDIESPWVKAGTGGVSPLSFLTFFAARPEGSPLGEAKKVSAAPHRGNA